MKTKLSIKLIALIIIVVIFGGIALTAALDLWSTGGSGSNRDKEKEGSGSGFVNGNTTFQQLYDMGITEDELEKILEIEPPSNNMKIREFCQNNGIEYSIVKNELQAIIDSAS